MDFTIEELERLKQGIGDAIFIIPFADSMGYPFKQKTQSSRDILVEFYRKRGGFDKTVKEQFEDMTSHQL